LVKLCVGNYSAHDGLVNGAYDIFQAWRKLPNSQEFIWILFNILKSGQLTRTKNGHFYEQKIHRMWTPIKPISKDIQIGSNSIHIITKIQFPIQLVATHTIHWTQGLTLDHLAFDPNGVYKYGSTFTTFSCIKNKENIHLFQPFTNEKFPNQPKCCHRNASITNNCTMGCPNTHTR
jgi:hypothetical protein